MGLPSRPSPVPPPWLDSDRPEGCPRALPPLPAGYRFATGAASSRRHDDCDDPIHTAGVISLFGRITGLF